MNSSFWEAGRLAGASVIWKNICDANLSQMKVCVLLFPLVTRMKSLLNLFVYMMHDVNIICSIPTSKAGVEDKLIRQYNQFGSYSFKSGYYVAKSIRELGGAGENSLISNCCDPKYFKVMYSEQN